MPTHILVIEDNPDNQQLVTWILEDEGYEVTCAGTAEAGLESLRSGTDFALVLMDISLPGMDGKEATQVIRQDPGLSSTKIIALTAHAVLQERESIIAAGVDAILTKPVDEGRLIKEITQLMGSQAASN